MTHPYISQPHKIDYNVTYPDRNGGLSSFGKVGYYDVEECQDGAVLVAMEQALFVDHVGEAMGGGAEGLEEGQGLVEVGDAVAELEDAACDSTQHDDLGGEVGGLDVVEVV